MNRAIILAAGSSERFGSPKLFETLWGKPVLFWSFKAFQDHPNIHEIDVVISENHKKELQNIAHNFPKIARIILGGSSRFESSQKAIEKMNWNSGDFLVFHNAANPGVTKEEISEVLNAAKVSGASGVGRKMSSTVRRISKDGSEVIPRDDAYEMETPQVIRADIFQKGVKKWKEEKREDPTDDLQLAEILGIVPNIVPANFHNRKITFSEDLLLLENFKKWEYRTGIGEDSHFFTEEKKTCMIGGIEIPETPGFSANSDGDVALHALCNALLSALGKNSFSFLANPMCEKGITDSSRYLEEVLQILLENNGKIENVSLTFEAKTPKLEKHFPRMRQRLSALLKIPKNRIGLTVHSGEELSDYGKGKGVRCFASVLVKIFPEE